MKRLVFPLALLLLASCEDGPTQTFGPSPDGAGDRWNDGRSDTVSDPSKQSFSTELGGSTKQEICTGPEKKAAWAKMFAAPIVPPRLGAGLDMAGSDQWEGLTIEQAEKVNCQSTALDTGYNYWGDNAEVVVGYRVSTRKINYLGFDNGYEGKIDFKSRDGQVAYQIGIGTQLQKGPAGGTLSGMVISWDNDPATGMQKWATELTDALFATFAPGLPAETDCRASGHCVIGFFGDQGYLFIPALGTAFRVANVNAPQPTPSKVSYMDQYLEKVMPFSQASTLIKLDQAGPVGLAQNLGPGHHTCTLQMGLTYGSFLSECVRVAGDAKKDDAETNKLLGGLAHNAERFAFDLSGVDVNFSDKTLGALDVIRDQDRPSNDDVATAFDVDQSTLGAMANDYTGNDVTKPKDYHGTGLVYAEFIRLAQEAINANLPAAQRHALGAPECLTGDPSTFATGCTGLEGFVIPLDPTKVEDATLKKLAVAPSSGVVAPIRAAGGLKPGHQKVVLCDDAARTSCQDGETFSTMYKRLLQVLGHGSTATLPPDLQDARFFFQKWSMAFFKYLLAENAGGTITHAAVKAAQLDPNNLFFDSVGAGQFEISEYVDRRFASATQDPTDVQITADVKNGIVNDYEFSRDLYRGETAIYSALATSPSKAPGSEDNALLVNIFGSPVLKNLYADTANATAYECATGAKDVTACEGQKPPMANGQILRDDLGRPILAPYKEAIAGTSPFQLGPTSVFVSQTIPALESAVVNVSVPGKKTGADFLVPWLPKQPGVGFPIAVSGTLDRFISTYQLDFSGTTISANVDYDFVDPTNPNKGLTFLAVETTDFLGEVFLCQHAATGDLLSVRMYTPAASLLDWFAKHPGASSDCGLVVRYSPYGNYPDFISTLSTGVRLGITQGGGFGRVVDVTLFVPGQ